MRFWTRIALDKNTYEAGGTAKGTFLTNADKSLKIKNLKLSVYGKERYVRGMMGGHGDDSAERYDIFFLEDLTPHLKPTFAFSQSNDDKIEIPVGSYSIPFHFSIPTNALESYQGKDVRIFYEVEVHVDMGRWKRDYRRKLPFVVTNPKMDYRIGDRYYLDKEQEKEEGRPNLEMELETKDSKTELPKFSPGETIKGRLKMENIEQTRVSKAIIELHSIEYARWGRPRTVFDTRNK